jgi:gamma-glutamyltranspeptidase/glutathione hydrolase
MAPTIVLQGGQVRTIVGSPGGSRIITIVLETLLNMIDYDMAPQEAVDTPRLHLQWLPDVLYSERFALSPDTRATLTRMGYRIEEQRPWGAAALIAVETAQAAEALPSGPDSAPEHHGAAATFYGANDSRRPAGAAIAP